MSGGPSPSRLVYLLAYGVASLIAVAAGCWTAYETGARASLWVANVVAWFVGLAVAVPLSAVSFRRYWKFSLLCAVVLMAATLVGPGPSGVHRWIGMGSFHFNAAQLLLPIAVVMLGVAPPDSAVITGALAAICLTLALQPDRSQAGAMTAAVAVLAATRWRASPRWLIHLGISLIAFLASDVRPDSLAPVPHVEGIIGLAASVNRFAATVMVCAVVVASMWPASVRDGTPGRPHAGAGYALAAYLCVSLLFGLLAAFPIPLAGLSISPIIGYWLAAGALLAVNSTVRRDGSRPDHSDEGKRAQPDASNRRSNRAERTGSS